MTGSIRGFAGAAALGLLIALLCPPPPPCAAARPLAMARGSATTSSEEAMIIALAPSAWSSGDERGRLQWRAAGAAAARAGKWLPFVAGGGGAAGAAARYPYGRPLWGLPAAAAAGRMVPWAAATAAPGLVFRTGGQLMEEEPHVEDAAARQEQAAMWASLLNPAQVRPAPAWTLAGNGEAEAPPADAEPTAEGMDAGDEPAAGGMLVGQPKWPGSP